MNWFKKLLSRSEDPLDPEEEEEDGAKSPKRNAPLGGPMLPGLERLRFGHYSDNNKTPAQTKAWYGAEECYKQKQWGEVMRKLFLYLRDDKEDAVRVTPGTDGSFQFEMAQGSRLITGSFDGKHLHAITPLASGAQPGTAPMRRLLELNYNLFYSRAGLSPDGTFYLLFDSDAASASPNKVYFGLRELATKADKMDESLLADFPTLTKAAGSPSTPLPEAELATKLTYFRKWIEEALKRAESLNADSFAGAIAYVLLTTVYRIDFLMAPEGKLLSELEKISDLYWSKKDESPLVERNAAMKQALRELLDWKPEAIAECLYYSRDTFSIALPQKVEKSRDNINSSIRDSRWYVDNKYPDLAMALVEYGVLYNQFMYSMPQVLTDLTTIWCAVIYPEFFAALGLKEPLADAGTETLHRDRIQDATDIALSAWKEKYPSMKWEHSRVRYSNRYDFATSFADQMIHLNLDAPR
jgi:hypothetical protein